MRSKLLSHDRIPRDHSLGGLLSVGGVSGGQAGLGTPPMRPAGGFRQPVHQERHRDHPRESQPREFLRGLSRRERAVDRLRVADARAGRRNFSSGAAASHRANAPSSTGPAVQPAIPR